MVTLPLLAVGILLIFCYWGGRIANALKLPRVSGYLLVGMLLGPSFCNVLPRQLIDDEMHIISEIALGVIAYLMGGSLPLDRIRRLGKCILWVTVFQAAGALLFTGTILVLTIPFLTELQGPEYDLLGTYLPMALVLAAISIATASGAVLAVITELRASGPFTTTLLSVIAISYGLTLIFFSLASTFSRFLIDPQTASCFSMLWKAIAEIGLSLSLGAVAGLALKSMARFVRRREALLMIVLGSILTTCGLAYIFKLSPLVANLVLGFMIVNLEVRQHDFFTVIERIEEPLFGLFFGLAGAHVDLDVFRSAAPLAVVAFTARVCGKQLGALVGSRICNAPRAIRDYLGLALSPQAGWTIALVIVELKIFPISIVSKILINAVIGSVIIGQLIGLPMVKHALTKVGETLNQRRAQEVSHQVMYPKP